MTSSPNLASDTNAVPVRRGVRVLIFVLIGLCILFVIGYVQRLSAKEAVRSEIVMLEHEIVRAEQRKMLLADTLQRVDEPAYVGRIARDDLGLVQEGDRPLMVIDPPATPTPIVVRPTPTPAPAAGEPNWERWLNLIFPGPEVPR
jgi:cell division protein FtsB